MPWKKDDSGVLAVDGSSNPVWVSDSGEESGADYGLTLKRFGEVNAESKKRKEELRAIREKFAALDGIEDIAAYKLAADKALEAVKNQPEKDKELEAQIAGRVEAAVKAPNSLGIAKNGGFCIRPTFMSTSTRRHTITVSYLHNYESPG